VKGYTRIELMKFSREKLANIIIEHQQKEDKLRKISKEALKK